MRYESQGKVNWGVVDEEKIFPVKGNYSTLGEFIKKGVEEARNVLSERKESVGLQSVKLLSPITRPAQIVCQGANYAAHREESGLDGKRPPFNLIFTKGDSSLAGPEDEIICPEHVELLDYEIELGLVIGNEITEQVEVTKENIHEFVAGIVITNDISARDIQMTHYQWYKGKSYRTFCPTGPFLYLLDKDEMSVIHNLDVKLTVNGEVRQSSNTSQLLYKPEETLTELSGLMDFSPGDLLLTGTPGGVAMQFAFDEINALQNPHTAPEVKREIINKQKRSSSYLQEGDIIRCEVKSPDGRVNLGILENKVVSSHVKTLSIK